MDGIVDDCAPIGRRVFLAGAAAAAVLAGCSTPEQTVQNVAVHGIRQAGVDRPAQPQQHVVVSVLDLPESWPLPAGLARLGETIATVVRGGSPVLAGMSTTDLTVTVGLGKRLAAEQASELPGFRNDDFSPRQSGGDLFLQVCAGDPVVAQLAEFALTASLDGAARRWAQAGFRPPGRGAVRNLLGFPDGIENPRTEAEFDRDVWQSGGGTIAVVRRLRVDVAGFLAQPLRRQEETIGRSRADGTALSGGERIDLTAKTPEGHYLVPAAAHARRANALAAGVGPMFRRGYNYRNADADQGLLFLSYQRELRTFIATQRRLDEGDDLMRFVTATASGSFFVPPGFDTGKPLGSSIFTH